MSELFTVSASPHLHTRENTARIMWTVTLSLVPAGIWGVYAFGLRALWVILAAVLSAVAAEYGYQRVTGKKIVISDGSAFLTGLLMAYNLSPSVPLWIPVAGSFVAVFIGKSLFGGLGRNIFNPALVGRAFLLASWPQYMTRFPEPFSSADAMASATPLTAWKEGLAAEQLSYFDLFLGRHGGCIGEVCIAALLTGALLLLARGYISWHIPFTYVAVTGVFMYVFGGAQGLLSGDWLFHILSGGLILGAFFMATDYATSPLSRKGQLIFAAGCGLFTGVIRIWGGYPEGVSYAILIMNAFVPLIDKYVKPRIYGT